MFFKRNLRSKLLTQNVEAIMAHAEKVVAYRKDVIDQKDLMHIISIMAVLVSQFKDLLIAEKDVELTVAELDELLKKHGGKIYPLTFWGDNVETLVVVLILALGIRSFFFQPFKIPTNSMWPSYHGMIAEVNSDKDNHRSILSKAWRYLTLGAKNYKLLAPTEGTVMVPLFRGNEEESGYGRLKFKKSKGLSWFGLIPTTMREYIFYVGGQPVSIKVPWDFNLDSVIEDKYFSNKNQFGSNIVNKDSKTFSPKIIMTSTGPMLLLSKNIKQGETVLDFDILTGDALFVDRISYHFIQPRVGDAIVFRTRKIELLKSADGTPDYRYYIKRLVGVPGDILKIESYQLFQNGNPIEGAEAFDFNAKREGDYPGYTNRGLLAMGEELEVPEGFFFALGDNSPDSSDGRSWGFVPEKEVVGRAMFIFYPFTKRWGLTTR